MQSDAKLEREVAAIGGLSREELVARWEKTCGCPPPSGINHTLLERSAAWHFQAARLGGLSAAARAVLRTGRRSAEQARGAAERKLEGRAGKAAEDVSTITIENRPTDRRRSAGAVAPLPKGTRLMREWNGRMHVVDVTEEGILFDGKHYRSLTAVAKRITGAHWSGPRFFGL